MMTYMIGWEQEKDIFKLAKLRERKSRDLDHIKCIKSNEQKVLVKDNLVKERWKEYVSKLLNEDYVGDMRIKDHEIPRRDCFHYLGSIISKDWEIDEDVKDDKSGMVEVETCFWNNL